MNPQHLKNLSADFNLGEVISITEVIEGILNKNYILTTSNGKYFIKEVREKSKDLLPATSLVEKLMSERGIPAVCMLTSRNGEKFVEYEGSAYSVYPFLESDRSHTYSQQDYKNMGTLLAEIHMAGSKDIPELLTRNIYKEKPKEGVFEDLKRYKAQILAKKERSAVDEQFLTYIQLKLDLIPDLPMEPVLESSTLVHGDYQTGNLLIDQTTREIIGVCDWEKSEMEPRAHELARAILYISFGGDYEKEKGIESAKQIIESYNSVFPISGEELTAGFKVRLRRMVLTSWLENHYYDLGDARGNHFVSHETRLINDFVQGDMLSELQSRS